LGGVGVAVILESLYQVIEGGGKRHEGVSYVFSLK